MTNQNNAAQAAEPQTVLSFDERERILCQFIGEPINHDREMAIAIESAVLSKLRAPVADESPMAKMADALREKARQEQQAYQDRRNQATEWGPMPEGTEADRPIPIAPVAHVAGDETSRYLEWAKDRSAWEMPVGTPVYYAALASAPVAGEAREHIEQRAVNRYRPVPDGKLSYKVVAGDGTRSLYTGTKDSCLRVAAKLTEAFLDGAFVASDAAPQASAEAVRNAALEEAAHLMEQTGKRIAASDIRALKQPQAPKDGGQQRAAFDHPVFAFLLGEGQLHGVDFGERAPGAVGKWWWRKDLRAALSATQPEQGERDAK